MLAEALAEAPGDPTEGLLFPKKSIRNKNHRSNEFAGGKGESTQKGVKWTCAYSSARGCSDFRFLSRNGERAKM